MGSQGFESPLRNIPPVLINVFVLQWEPYDKFFINWSQWDDDLNVLLSWFGITNYTKGSTDEDFIDLTRAEKWKSHVIHVIWVHPTLQ